MNKTMKIASVAVASVMVGTMAFSIAGCSSSKKKDLLDGSKVELSADLTPKTDDSGKLTWTAGTQLNMNVGNQNTSAPQGISYLATDISGTALMPDGNTYGSGDLKPAWKELATQLNVTLKDVFQNKSSNNQITDPITGKNITDYDVITGSLQSINENSSNFLNLQNYLSYMPNYRAFLNANPVTIYSLTGNDEGAMYAAPYFDGNDDIEKYSMVNYLWVYDILDNALKDYSTTFKAQAEAKSSAISFVDGTKASATAFMGTTGNYTIETTSPTDSTKTVTVKVDYDAALSAAKDTSSELGSAIKDAAGTAYTGTSGNIVDLQNFVINTKAGEVTGKQLATILRAYIKVAYKQGNNQFYTKLSDVFCSQSAAWDVDLLVAMSRCVVTCSSDLTSSVSSAANIYAISGRQTTTQRRVDLVALAGELYGVRGMESRYEYSYFDKDGKLHDSRTDANSYELINNISKLTTEGLVNIGSTTSKTDENGKVTVSATSVNTNASGTQTFMLHDYVQTQTKYGITSEKDTTKYNFAPIVNAISNWDTDSDGKADTIMRFTESWRSVKNTGFAIPVESVRGNAEKLSAVLAFVDYLFSSDGQILMSYGTQSTNGDTNPNGWWYATEQTSVKLSDIVDSSETVAATNYAPAQYTVKDEYKDKYFVYKEKVYTGTYYNGTQVPTLTTINKSFYEGDAVTVNGETIQQKKGNILIGQQGNYTNYARYFIGSTLPIGNKNQGFEYQATSQCGITGALLVNTAIQNGTLKHVVLSLDDKQSAWYLSAPTSLPYSTANQSDLKGADQTLISGTYFLNSSSTSQITNIYIDLCYYGLGSDYYLCGKSEQGKYSTYNTGAKLVELLNNKKLAARVSIMQDGWYSINEYYGLGYDLAD
jgi:putative aldouronate transport system substrate-binding protein